MSELQTAEKESFSQRVRTWAEKNAESPHAKFLLFIISFTESVISPIPPDIMLAAMIASGATRWAHYAVITTIASVLGGILGYIIGFLFFDTFGTLIIETYNLGEHFTRIQELFNEYAFLSIFISGFTPIPYKIFTIAGGLFGINFFMFVVASLLSRGARYFLVAYIFKTFGKRLADLFYTYFNIGALVIVVLLILFFIFLV